jgi:mannose-6-phosphate isomerase-like protein (cupin superfamily)
MWLMFETKNIAESADECALDGSEVRLLLRRPGGSMAHFSLAAGQTSLPVVHQTVDELWYIVAGQGEMWRKGDGAESIIPLKRGICLSIPAGVAFQFKALGDEPLEAVAVTMPPWPGDDEARRVPGCEQWNNV